MVTVLPVSSSLQCGSCYLLRLGTSAGRFSQKEELGNGKPVSNGLYPLETLPTGLALGGVGVPRLLWEVIQSQPWQLVSLVPWTTIRERNQRENKGCSPGCRPAPSTPTCLGQGPVGSVPGAVLLHHPLPGPLSSSAGFQISSRSEWVFV